MLRALGISVAALMAAYGSWLIYAAIKFFQCLAEPPPTPTPLLICQDVGEDWGWIMVGLGTALVLPMVWIVFRHFRSHRLER
ncbi:hypothetical protein [Mesorhizobium helmanticense]|uniref:Uncharacterized protein n=1 Tax=Mesorhizobium helmanticense TaxID=1776423 RepID=A0A2T4J1U4_9HYPH|nr:hypothetical protein [Mesorhizobium helmanticense]PTE11808.1 hypothetical protein C9427_03760 [Mesorhizobium helmanticense]